MNLKTSWIDFIYNISIGTKKVRSLLTPIGVLIFGIFTSLFVIVAILVDNILNLPTLSSEIWIRALAVVLCATGLFFVFWSVIHFLKVKGTPVPINPPPMLVCTGPYAYSRNPMLTGVFILLFGIGFFLGSFSLIFIFNPLYILANYWELKFIEEPELQKRLGKDYSIYKEKTPMFFPRIKK